jgi:DNA (cytosine-5)-methyltransferase 1
VEQKWRINMIHLGDITKLDGTKIPKVDIICGGSPCQDLSVAGKREGLSGERSGLFMEQLRIIKEMREKDAVEQLSMSKPNEYIRPRFMVWENVPGAFSSNKGEDFRIVLEETAKVVERDACIPGPPNKGKWTPSGCIMGDGWSIAWRVHDAQFWGVPQRRKRIALVADFGGSTAPEILFERESVSGDITESKKQGKGIAEDVRTSVDKTSKCLNGWDVQSKHIQPENGIAESLYSGECRGGGGESYVLQKTSESLSFQERAGKEGGGKGILIQKERTGALSTLNNQPVCYGISSYNSNAMKSSNPHSGVYEAETIRTLDLNGGNPGCNQGGMAVVCLEGNGSRPSHQGDGWHEGDPMYTLNSTEHHAVCAGFSTEHSAKSRSIGYEEEISPTLRAGVVPATMAVENHPNDSRVKISEDGMVQTLSGRMESINGDIAGTLDASYYKGCGERQGVERTVVYGLDRASYNQGINAKYDFSVEAEKIATQTAKGPGAVYNNYIVRRLTPLECERLQGFPDNWTNIGEWIDSKGKKHKDADSPRYKALGNSIALPFWQWMAERMCAYIEKPTMASLFDGIGGFPLVFSRCGCVPIWASEIEEFPIAVTKTRFPE